MKRTFNIVCCLDVVLLILPTRHLGAPIEFCVAATLTVITAGLWMYHHYWPAG